MNIAPKGAEQSIRPGTKKVFRMLHRLLRKLIPSTGAHPLEKAFSQYEMSMPKHQNAIDALPGWNSAFPVGGLKAGKHPLHADDRIIDAMKAYGPLADKVVLEIGPLEGMHTYLLNQQKPARIDAIEANRLCFLRCLVTKEILGLNRARFYLGNIQPWLETNETIYDFALASGVLYHMPDPAGFLVQLSRRAEAVFIWTHYFDEKMMPRDDPRRNPFSGKVETRTVEGLSVRYYERSYQHANTDASFCGGMKDRHYWMHRDDILSLLERLGYRTIEVQGETPEHGGGPCFSVFARK